MIKRWLKKWWELILLIILMLLISLMIVTVTGCNDRQIRNPIKKKYVKSDFKTEEAWNLFICWQQSQIIQDGILKDKKNHNVLECQNLMNDSINRNKLNRSMDLYIFCKDKRYEKHSWQDCYDKILVK